MRRVTLAALAVAALCLAGCNAVRGLGQDIQSVGEAGDRAI